MSKKEFLAVCHADLDGLRSARLLKKHLPGNVTFLFFDNPYNQSQFDEVRALASPPSGKKPSIYFSDYASFPRDRILELAKIVPEITIYDHHLTNEAALKGGALPQNVHTFFDSNLCAAEIVFKEFSPGASPPDDLACISLVDRSVDPNNCDREITTPSGNRRKVTKTEYNAIACALDHYIDPKNQEEAFLKLSRLEKMTFEDIVKTGQKRLQEDLAFAKFSLKLRKYTFIQTPGSKTPLMVPFFNVDVTRQGGFIAVNEAGGLIKKYGAVFFYHHNPNNNNIVTLNIRTGPDFDAGKIAEFVGSFGEGGGGQLTSARARLPMDIFKGLLRSYTEEEAMHLCNASSAPMARTQTAMDLKTRSYLRGKSTLELRA